MLFSFLLSFFFFFFFVCTPKEHNEVDCLPSLSFCPTFHGISTRSQYRKSDNSLPLSFPLSLALTFSAAPTLSFTITHTHLAATSLFPAMYPAAKYRMWLPTRGGAWEGQAKEHAFCCGLDLDHSWGNAHSSFENSVLSLRRPIGNISFPPIDINTDSD